MGRLTEGFDLLVAVARAAYEEEIRYPAAALAYYAFVSFVPLLLLVFAVSGERLVSGLAQTAPKFLTPKVQNLVDRSLSTASGRVSAGLLSVLVLIWSSLNIVGDIRAVVGRIEGADQPPSHSRIRDGVAILGSLGLAMLAIVVTSLLFEFPVSGPLFGLEGIVVLGILLVGAFVPLYYVPSEVVISPARALPGAGIASAGWTSIHAGVQFYATHAGQYAIYGVLSGIIIVLTTLYLAAIILFVGFIVNVWATTGLDLGDESSHREPL